MPKASQSVAGHALATVTVSGGISASCSCASVALGVFTGGKARAAIKAAYEAHKAQAASGPL